MSDIGDRRYAIEDARRKYMQSVMHDYDTTVYHPAREQLVKDCYAEGHAGGVHHDNGFGWSWMYCGKCGGRYKITGPNDERKPDSGSV